jgi:hypothetical protein
MDQLVADIKRAATIRSGTGNDLQSELPTSPIENMDRLLRSNLNELRFLKNLVGSSRIQSRILNTDHNYRRNSDDTKFDCENKKTQRQD